MRLLGSAHAGEDFGNGHGCPEQTLQLRQIR
jgi:hypothetical protein